MIVGILLLLGVEIIICFVLVVKCFLAVFLEVKKLVYFKMMFMFNLFYGNFLGLWLVKILIFLLLMLNEFLWILIVLLKWFWVVLYFNKCVNILVFVKLLIVIILIFFIFWIWWKVKCLICLNLLIFILIVIKDFFFMKIKNFLF